MNLHTLHQALGIVKDVTKDKNLVMHHLQMLIFIGNHRSVTYQQIQEEFDLSNVAASRSANALCDTARHRQNPYGLVQIYRDPHEGRRYRLALSPKGLHLYEQLEAL